MGLFKNICETIRYKYKNPIKDVLVFDGRYQEITPYLPDVFFKLIFEKWKIKHKSPFSDSFYDYDGKTWDYTKDGGSRISDHWNFKSAGKLHAKTDKSVKNGDWALGIYDGEAGIYNIKQIIKRQNKISDWKKIEWFEEFATYYKNNPDVWSVDIIISRLRGLSGITSSDIKYFLKTYLS